MKSRIISLLFLLAGVLNRKYVYIYIIYKTHINYTWILWNVTRKSAGKVCKTYVNVATLQSPFIHLYNMHKHPTIPQHGWHRDFALRPTILFKAAGTRPLPAVSVPKEKVTCQPSQTLKPTRWGAIFQLKCLKVLKVTLVLVDANMSRLAMSGLVGVSITYAMVHIFYFLILSLS